MVSKISAISLTETPPSLQPNPSGTREEYFILPGESMDTRWWVLHTETMLKSGDWRVRTTNLDNAPEGREVHWSSLLIWILAGLAGIFSLGSGAPAHTLVAEAAMIAGPVLLAAFLLFFCIVLTRRLGWLEFLFAATVLLGCHPVIANFQAGEADHHGLVIMFAFACVLFLWLGDIRDRSATSKSRKKVQDGCRDSRESVTLSAVFGAAALWISAATAIPILVGVAAGGVLSSVARRSDGRVCTSESWTHWGRVGCITSLGFYVLEYFPLHMGMRLEVNHPVYAFSWLVGGYWLAITTAAIQQRKMPDRRTSLAWFGLAIAGLLPAFLILLFRSDVFWVSDSFLLNLHKSYIHEFQSLPSMVRNYGNDWSFLLNYSWPIFVCLAMGAAALTGALKGEPLRAVLLLLPPTLLMQSLAIYQIRWASAAFVLWALIAIVMFYYAILLGSESRPWRWIYRGALAFCVISLIVGQIPQLLTVLREEQTCVSGKIDQEIGSGILLRDIAHRLIQSSPQKTPVVLTGPNSSTELAYHGRIKTLGTLYWENTPGLKNAAALFTSQTEEATRSAILSSGITHIVVPSWDNFTEAYNTLLGMKTSAVEPYLNLVLKGKEWPQWLRPFAYPIPGDSGLDSNAVKIYAVVPEQGHLEALFHRGVYHFDSGQFEEAKKLFDEVCREVPSHGPSLQYLQQIRDGANGKDQQSKTTDLP